MGAVPSPAGIRGSARMIAVPTTKMTEGGIGWKWASWATLVEEREGACEARWTAGIFSSSLFFCKTASSFTCLAESCWDQEREAARV
jgi:hypothetical protein